MTRAKTGFFAAFAAAGAACGFAVFGPGPRGYLASALAAGMIAFSLADLPEHIMTQLLLLGVLLLGLAFHAVYGPSLADAVAGAMVAYAGLWLAGRFVCGAGITDKDRTGARVAAAIGAWIGVSAIPAVLMIAFAASVLILFPAVLCGRIGGRAPVRFASLLAFAALCALFSPALSASMLGSLGH